MPETVECDECGKEVDSRGMTMHKRMTHADGGQEVATDGGPAAAEVDGEELVTVDRDDLDGLDDEEMDRLPAVESDDESITLRRHDIQEIVITDEEIKQELADELKEFIRGGSLRV